MIDMALFILWTFLIYWIHRVLHHIPILKNIHADHHIQVHKKYQRWHWSNLFLYIDTPKSTLDQWITEIIPTLIFSWITGTWWLSVFYYLWAAIIQEAIEHNDRFDIYPFLTSGKWHLVHHSHPTKNFGLFFGVWDKMFGTFLHHDQISK